MITVEEGAGATAGSALPPVSVINKVRRHLGGGGNNPPPPPGPPGDGDEEEDGMLRMSFLEHLEELRTRIFRALAGIGVAFILSLSFSSPLWTFVRQPATD